MTTTSDAGIARSAGQCPRPSTLIAEALVERQSARQIVARACALGLPDPTTEVILAACGSTAGSARGVASTRVDRSSWRASSAPAS